MLKALSIDHIVLNVADVDATSEWYAKTLGMRREDADSGSNDTIRTSMLFGNQKINLEPISGSQGEWFNGENPASGSADICFIANIDPNDVIFYFQSCDIEIEQGPIMKRGARGAIRSVYCRDPDGNLIGIASYP